MEQTIETRMSYNYGMITEKNKKQWMERQRKYLVPLLQRRMMMVEMKEDEENEDIPIYIEQVFNHFCDRRSSVNLSCIGMEIEFMNPLLKEILFNDWENADKELNVKALNDIFPNLKSYINMEGESVNVSQK